MTRKFAAVLLLLPGAVPPTALSQPANACNGAKSGSVACLTVDMIDNNFQQLGVPPPAAGASETGIPAIAGQLSTVAPLPSPASGFVYVFDPTTGVFTQSTNSYGPILSERAETIGAHRFSFGFVDQFFDFTSVDGLKLSNLPTDFQFSNVAYGVARFDLHLRLNQFTLHGTYGLNRFLDISIAAPIISSQFGGSLSGSVHLGPLTSYSSTHIDRAASGFGDLQFQVKANPIRNETGGIAFGVNVRTATGDPYALLGAGAVGVQPFIAASKSFHHWLTPHVNAAYQWNGESVLAGNVTTEAKAHLAGNISYAAGAELSVNRRLTLIEDLIGAELIHAPRASEQFGEIVPGVTVGGVGFYNRSFNSTGLSNGLKFNPGGHFLIDFNLLVRLNNGGLRAPVVPLLGVSYVFDAPTQPTPKPRANAPVQQLKVIPLPEPHPPSVPPDYDAMVRELDPRAHFVAGAPPTIIPFHNGHYLRLTIATTLPKTASGSQYRLAALAFDQHIAHLIRPVAAYLKSGADFDGIDFSTTVRLAGDQPADTTPLAVEFIFPLAMLQSYAQFDSTGQQLIDAGFVLINGERVGLNLQLAEAGFP